MCARNNGGDIVCSLESPVVVVSAMGNILLFRFLMTKNIGFSAFGFG
jgi:hypothetical protein